MVTDEQVIGLRALLKYGAPLWDAARVTEMNESTAWKYARLSALPSEIRKPHTWRTRPDPFAEMCCELAKRVRAEPSFPATQLLERLMVEFPDRFLPNQVRTLQRRAVCWKQEQCHGERRGGTITSLDGVLAVLQNTRAVDELQGTLRPFPDLPHLLEYLGAGYSKDRNKALTIVALQHGFPKTTVAKFLGVSEKTVSRYAESYALHGLPKLFTREKNITKKADDPRYADALMAVLHSPPRNYGINRTTWKQDDLHRVLAAQGFGISRQNIRAILKKQGYRWRQAHKVLTSRDPEYREKVARITAILANIGPRERFFSIDEFGPFSITTRGGRKLVAPGDEYTVPQWQKSKGSLIITAALELCTNEVTHFYSERKNTDEMLRLLDVLLKQYADMETLYLSWDAASWHLSDRFEAKVAEINSMRESRHEIPRVELAPLPSGAQFLNVIESVFSGMARAIIHNSDYQSEAEAMQAIDRYFDDRNIVFKQNPRRAGKKIWGKERVAPQFSESNNCKDPKWR
jgi:transposase